MRLCATSAITAEVLDTPSVTPVSPYMVAPLSAFTRYDHVIHVTSDCTYPGFLLMCWETTQCNSSAGDPQVSFFPQVTQSPPQQSVKLHKVMRKFQASFKKRFPYTCHFKRLTFFVCTYSHPSRVFNAGCSVTVEKKKLSNVLMQSQLVHFYA